MAEVTSGMLDSLQNAVIEQAVKKKDTQKYHFDKLKMFFKEDFLIKGIRIVQPTVGDILRIGEKDFYSALSPFINNSTSIRLMLWSIGIDWCKVRDIEVFGMLMEMTLQSGENYQETLNLIFPDIDITKFKVYEQKKESDTDEKKFFLYNEQSNMYLLEEEYMEIAEYVREMLNIHLKVERAKGKTTKKWMIDEDRQNLLTAPSKNDSSLLPLVSSLINHPGFKYNLNQLKEVGIVQFYDAIQRLQIYEGTRALLQGSYSGFCDTSGVDKNKFNFMRDVDS